MCGIVAGAEAPSGLILSRETNFVVFGESVGGVGNPFSSSSETDVYV